MFLNDKLKKLNNIVYIILNIYTILFINKKQTIKMSKTTNQTLLSIYSVDQTSIFSADQRLMKLQHLYHIAETKYPIDINIDNLKDLLDIVAEFLEHNIKFCKEILQKYVMHLRYTRLVSYNIADYIKMILISFAIVDQVTRNLIIKDVIEFFTFFFKKKDFIRINIIRNYDNDDNEIKFGTQFLEIMHRHLQDTRFTFLVPANYMKSKGMDIPIMRRCYAIPRCISCKVPELHQTKSDCIDYQFNNREKDERFFQQLDIISQLVCHGQITCLLGAYILIMLFGQYTGMTEEQDALFIITPTHPYQRYIELLFYLNNK